MRGSFDGVAHVLMEHVLMEMREQTLRSTSQICAPRSARVSTATTGAIQPSFSAINFQSKFIVFQ